MKDANSWLGFKNFIPSGCQLCTFRPSCLLFNSIQKVVFMISECYYIMGGVYFTLIITHNRTHTFCTLNCDFTSYKHSHMIVCNNKCVLINIYPSQVPNQYDRIDVHY